MDTPGRGKQGTSAVGVREVEYTGLGDMVAEEGT